MIELRDLSVRFGKDLAVDHVSFRVPSGGSLALWGENGAGKTTLIRALLGLLPFEGQASLAGHVLPAEGRAARAKLGYVPQHQAYYRDMRSLALLRFFAGLRGSPASQAPKLLERVGLSEQANKRCGALSGGMQQRLALAVALLGDPEILILDEPTANLDSAARSDCLDLLDEQRAAGKTLLLTSHRVEEVKRLADRVLVLENGRMQPERDLAGLWREHEAIAGAEQSNGHRRSRAEEVPWTAE